MQKARQSGASASQQLMMGLLVAPVEWAGGKVVINQLSKVASAEAAKSGIKSLLKSIGAQAATNFTTEAATEALNIVSELAVMQDKSQAVQYYNDYVQKHPGSESMALVDTMMQQLARVGKAGLAGAVAGGMMGAAATVWRRAQIEQMGHAAQADAQAIVQEGLSYGEGTQAYQQATEINQQMKEGEHPGDVQLGGLIETNAATDLDQQQITSALESRDGQPVDNERQAGYAGNKVEGEGIDHDTHTDSSGAEAPAEPTAPQTERVQQGESAEAGQVAGAEGDFSHQGVEDAAEGAESLKAADFFYQFNTYGDALRESLGPAYQSHKAEYDDILRQAKEYGVEVTFRKGILAYEPSLTVGKPGRLILDPDASIGALRHEFKHLLDDADMGHPGFQIMANRDQFWEIERRGYMEELDLARQIKDARAEKLILQEMQERKKEIFGGE